MRALPLFAIATLAGLLIVCPTGALFAQERASVLEVRSKSWVKNSSFDTEAFMDRCHETGVELHRPDSSLPKSTTVSVDYEEKRGSGFSHFGVGNPEGWGTDIALAIAFVDGIKAETFKINLHAETPSGLAVEQFHQGARDALTASPGYRLACSAIAGALGSRPHTIRLLPWAVFDAQATALLKNIRFEPASPGERAYVALANRRFDELQVIGEPAIEPLALLLRNSLEDRDGYGTYPADAADRTAHLVKAIALLELVADPQQSAESLVQFLNDYTEAQRDPDPVAAPALIAAIRGLGEVGGRFSLPLVQEWARGNTAIAQAAQQAVAAIRKRVEF